VRKDTVSRLNDSDGLDLPGRESQLVARHRAWLERAGLLHRPWFFLASAPDPTIPPLLPPNAARIYIKWAGHTGKKLGLPQPDLLFVNDYNLRPQTSDLNCHRVLALTAKRKKVIFDRFRRLNPFASNSLKHITDAERDWILDTVVGDAFRGKGDMPRPSNGIALIAYGLLLGVPQIIVSGMSLTDNGHTNPTRKKHQRLHKEEDHASFVYFAENFPGVSTSEPELSELTGLPLYR
jgi:hypothetical protein